MANLQVKDIDDRLYKALKQRAKMEKRSLSQEVVKILEEYLSRPQKGLNRVEAFLELSWDDHRETEEIIAEIRQRHDSQRFSGNSNVFD